MGAETTVAPGTVIGDRFELEAAIGAGGMGAVYRARDRRGDTKVAVKLLASADASADRFVREARLLAELSHPAIVRYLAHGSSPAGPFLAMEWLEGEDLSQRLAREALGLDDTLKVVCRAAEGLAVAHRAGVIHRDIKPSNLFLQNGEPSRLKLLDFGVARAHDTTRVMTRTGMMLGTVGYMAPEQARGIKDIDARVDIFALGCVFYECVTGRSAFQGANPMALLAQLMLEDPPRISELRPDVSPTVDELVARMMAKDREARPANVEAVLVALESLGRPSAPAPTTGTPAVGMTGSEQRLLNVLLVQLEEPDPDATLTPEQARDEAEAVQAVVEPFGGQCTRLGLGPYLVMMQGRGAATDEADRAASCALAVAEAFPEGRVALATGRAGTGAGMPLGPGVERASELLEGASSGAVRIDSVTESLLDPRFEVSDGELRGEAGSSGGVRTLLGKPTRCVGRRKELRLLRDMMDECVEERFTQAMLVTAPAGTGKSRLRHELLTGVDSDQWTVLEARATPVGAGAPLLLVRQLVEDWLDDVTDFDGILQQVDRLELSHGTRVAEFLGVVVGIPSDRDPSPQLQVARNDERLMADWIQRSVAEWLAALAARGPLLTVLEDLHWGDAATVAHIDLAFRNGRKLPWLVLALARPEVDDVFPRLWPDIEPQRLDLRGLSDHAAERLVRDVLPDLSDDEVAEIVERAAGNAFFLEELIRHASDGGGALPETVLAMMESRLMNLEQQPRRVLQAASVLGERFPGAGVEVLSGSPAVDWLQVLVERELLEVDREQSAWFTFRHGLLRDAAYAMLSPDDRKRAHRAAAEWLEERGNTEPLVLIEHFELADQSERAAPWYLEAVKVAYGLGAMESVESLAKRGCRAATDESVAARLQMHRALSLLWDDQVEPAFALYDEALPHLPKDSTEWLMAACSKFFLGIMGNRLEMVLGELAAILQLPALPAHDSKVGQQVFLAATALGMGDQGAMAASYLERVQADARRHQPDPSFDGWMLLAQAMMAETVDDEPSATLAATERSIRLGQEVQDPLLVENAQVILAIAFTSLGRHADARQLVEHLSAHSLRILGTFAQSYAFGCYIELGEYSAAAAVLDALETRHQGSVSPLRRRVLRAALEVASGSAPVAIGGLEECLRQAGPLVPKEDLARGAVTLARAYLAADRPGAALETEPSLEGLTRTSGLFARTRGDVLQTHADALLASGQVDEAKRVIGGARDRLLGIRDSLPESYRSDFMTGNYSHRRTMELASELLDA